MEAIIPTIRCMRPLSRRSLVLANSTQQTRSKATAQRQRKSLRVRQAPSFVPEDTESEDHIVYNPPPTPPNVYHTPFKFLPTSDPRRQLHLLTIPPSAPAKQTTAEAQSSLTAEGKPSALAELARSYVPQKQRYSLPPLVGKPHERKYHLTPEDVEEIRKLRAMDGRTWTVGRLAKFFGCSEFFIRLCAYNLEAKERHDKNLAEVKNRWGRTKREAREERDRRREGWGRGE